jgi:regulation of enolase protein 1 (concanavalin A-like superfamily)
MRAKFTQDLFSGRATISVKTCSEAINYMGEIYGFIKDNGLAVKMTTDFYTVNFTIHGFDELRDRIPVIMKFINKGVYLKDMD